MGNSFSLHGKPFKSYLGCKLHNKKAWSLEFCYMCQLLDSWDEDFDKNWCWGSRGSQRRVVQFYLG